MNYNKIVIKILTSILDDLPVIPNKESLPFMFYSRLDNNFDVCPFQRANISLLFKITMFDACRDWVKFSGDHNNPVVNSHLKTDHVYNKLIDELVCDMIMLIKNKKSKL